MGYFKAIIRGNLGGDATVKEVSGQFVINFSVAFTEKVNGQEQTTWVKCAYWRTQQQGTSFAQYLTKGQSVLVEGKPRVSTYTKQDGSFGASLEMTAYSVDLCGSSGGQQQAQPSDHAQHYQDVQQRAQAQVFNKPAQAQPAAAAYSPTSKYAMPGSATTTSAALGDDDLPF